MNGIAVFALSLLSLNAAPEPIESQRVNKPVEQDMLKWELEQGRARRYINDWARCLARGDKRRAQAALALPYGSAEQAEAAKKVLPTDHEAYCMGPMGEGTMQLGFQWDSLVAGMAEYFLIKRKGSEFPALTPEQLSTPDREPRNSAEEFSQCVVSQNPGAVYAMVAADPGTPAEKQAIAEVTPLLANCIEEHQTLALDAAAMRHTLAVGLYRYAGVTK